MSVNVESRFQLKEYDWNDFFSPSPNPRPSPTLTPTPGSSVLVATPRTTSSFNPTTTPETLRTSCPVMSNHVPPPYPSQLHVGSWSHSPKHPPPPSPQFHQPSTIMMSPAPGLPQPNVVPSCPRPASAFSSITLPLPRPLPPRPEIVDKSRPLPSPPHMLQQPKRKPPHSRSHQPNCQSLLRPPPVPFIKHGEADTNHVMCDRKPPATSSLPIQSSESTPNSTLHLGNLPSLPPGPPPTSQCPINGIQNQNQYQPPEGQLSGLLGSLMAKGLISLPTQPTEQVVDFQPVEFDSVALNVRHESTIRALYADLPRQCKTCGLRFKTQAEHSSHMDWHVTKNRASKNGRHNKPSRKWFVSDSNWLRGAQALPGADQAVSVFFAADPVVEKNQDDELVVAADEHQNACALCREPFDYFFSEETDDWMYRGAVYLNVPNGIIAGMDESHQLGPIVHAKCRPDNSSVVPTANCAQQAHANEENGPSARKRKGDNTEGDLCTTKPRHCY